MKLLVTGGAGFIGSEFVRQGIKKGYEIVVIDKLTYAGDLERLKEVMNEIKFYKVDIQNFKACKEIFSKEKPNVVVHFAAETHVDRSIINPKTFLKTNIYGTFNVLEISRKFHIEKFINIITDEVYGEIQEGSFTEDSSLVPNSPYSVSKAAQDMLGRAYHRTYELPVITVRPSNNYGPWQYPEKLIPVVILKALKEEPIPVYGKGLNVREWIYVSDCVEAIFEIIEKGKLGEIYNVGSGIEKTNIEVVKSILYLIGKSEKLIKFIKDRPGHDYRYSVNTKKINREIGWVAKTNFEEGIEKTVKWYLDNKNWLESKIKQIRRYWKKVYDRGIL